MTVILIGNDSSDRETNSYSGYDSVIDANWPADGTGELTSLWTRCTTNCTAYFFTAKHMGDNVFRLNAVTGPHSLVTGLNTLSSIHLPVMAGEYLGVYFSSGQIDASALAGTGYWYTAQNLDTEGEYAQLTFYAGRTLTLGGSGATGTTSELTEECEALLTDLKTTYLPAVNEWLFDNWEYMTSWNLVIGLLCKVLLESGTPGGLYTGPTLQQIKDVLGTPYETTLADQHTAILTSFSDQHTAQDAVLEQIADDLADPAGHLAIAETNIENAITVAKQVILGTPATDIQEVKAAVDAISVPADVATATNVSDAVATLTGEVGEAVTDINAHTDSALALLDFAQAADITAAHSTTNGLITALNNLSEVAVQALVDAAVGTVTGELDEAVGIISGLINAIEPGGDVRYPGYDLTTRGTTVRVTSQGTVSAAVHGVGGKMEGVLLSMVDVPERCTERVVQGRSNYRYPGWIVFADSQGNCDEPQWCNMDQRVYAPKLIAEPALCICGFADGVVADVTPWVVT